MARFDASMQDDQANNTGRFEMTPREKQFIRSFGIWIRKEKKNLYDTTEEKRGEK